MGHIRVSEEPPSACCCRQARQPPEHQSNHRGVDEGFARLGQVLVVFAHPPVAPQPCERAFNDPPPRQRRPLRHRLRFDINGAAPPLRGALHDLDRPPELRFDPFDGAAAVARPARGGMKGASSAHSASVKSVA